MFDKPETIFDVRKLSDKVSARKDRLPDFFELRATDPIKAGRCPSTLSDLSLSRSHSTFFRKKPVKYKMSIQEPILRLLIVQLHTTPALW
jgi:hypothetical protein